MPLSFTAGATSITATTPLNANIAPPGPYMLFILDGNGVPSVARMVSIQNDSPPAVALTQPASGTSFTAPATVNLTATASDSDGTVTKVEFFNGPAKTRRGRNRPLRVHLDWRHSRHLHPHRPRHRQPRRHHHKHALHDHSQHPEQHPTERDCHLTGRRRDLRVEADDHGHGHCERPRRPGHEGGVPRRHSLDRSGHERALLRHVEERRIWKPRDNCTRHRQLRGGHHQQPRRHHRSPQALSAFPVHH